MKKTIYIYICVVVLFISLLFACTNNVSQQKNAEVRDSLSKSKWVNPRKGKIWDKENIVQIPLTALENHILGSIKSVNYKSYKVSVKDGTKTLDDSGYNVYDKLGHLIEQSGFNADGTQKWKCEYKYSGNKAVMWHFIFDTPKDETIVIFKYDNEGRKYIDSTFDADMKYRNRVIYQYDDRGNIVKEVRYKDDDKDSVVEIYKYDKRNFQIQYRMTSSNKSINLMILKEYNDDGNPISIKNYANDTTDGRIGKYVYDNKGRCVQTINYNKDGSIHEINKNKFDEWDNIIESISYNAGGSIDSTKWNTCTEFEYDNHGNAIKETWYKIIHGQKTLMDVVEKKYQYYE